MIFKDGEEIEDNKIVVLKGYCDWLNVNRGKKGKVLIDD